MLAISILLKASLLSKIAIFLETSLVFTNMLEGRNLDLFVEYELTPVRLLNLNKNVWIQHSAFTFCTAIKPIPVRPRVIYILL